MQSLVRNPLLVLALGAIVALAGCRATESTQSTSNSATAEPDPAAQTPAPPTDSDGRTETAASTPEPRSLNARLTERRMAWAQSAPPERQRIYQDGINAVAESGVLDSAMHEGDAAPNFTLPHATGAAVELAALLKDGPVVLIWYRGGWCPYCNIQLQAYQEILPKIRAHGASLVAISPELPDKSLTTAEKNALEFYVLSDVGNRVARDYGLLYTLPEPVIEQFRGRLDLPGYNGDDSWELPLAAAYVIDTDGTIRYAFVSADYRVRAEPVVVLNELRALKR